MNMDRNSLLAIVCCVVFFIAYQSYMSHKYPHLAEPKGNTELTQDSNPAEALPPTDPFAPAATATAPTLVPPTDQATASEAQPDFVQLSEQDLSFSTPDVTYQFDQTYSALTSIVMTHYHKEVGDPALMDIVESPLIIQAGTNVTDLRTKRGYQAQRQGSQLKLERQEGPWHISQTFSLPESGYEVPIHLSYTNKSAHGMELTASLLMQQNVPLAVAQGGFGPTSFAAHQKALIQGVGGGRDFEDLTSLCKDDETKRVESFNLTNEAVDFVGIDTHYFLSVVKPEAQKMSVLAQKSPKQGDYCPVTLVMYQPMGFIKPGESVTLDFKAYLGPKDLSQLKKHDPAFAQTMNFKTLGMDLSIVANPLLRSLQFFHQFIPNYGFAIAIVTILLKILFYPLTKSAAISMKRMQKLQPEITKIKDTYKADPQKQQQILMGFLAKNKANPMKSCLAILPQMPVFLSFYSVLGQAIELRHANLFGWVTDLSVADPYYILPLLLGVLFFAQQKLTPNPAMDPTQQKVMMIMPFIFTFMMLALPSGLVLYMIVNTLVSIVQQQWLNKRFEHMDFKIVPA